MPELPYRTIHLDRGRHASHAAGKRAALCVAWVAERQRQRLPRRFWRLRRVARGRGGRFQSERELAATWAARSISLDGADAHASALELLDRLLVIGLPQQPLPVEHPPVARVA